MIRRAGVGVLVGVVGGGLGGVVPARATSQPDEPVRLAVSAPAVASLDLAVPITVTVTSDPGAFDIADAPVRLRVRLSPGECRDTFDTTSGAVAIDARLSLPPRPSPAFTQTLSGHAAPADYGGESVCAFVEEEGSNRLFANDTDTQVVVSRPCTAATRSQASAVAALAEARAALAAVQRRLDQARRRLARARHGARHRARGGRRRARRRARRRLGVLTRQAQGRSAAVAARIRALESAQAAVRTACGG